MNDHVWLLISGWLNQICSGPVYLHIMMTDFMDYMHTWVLFINQLVYKMQVFENRQTNFYQNNQTQNCPNLAALASCRYCFQMSLVRH